MQSKDAQAKWLSIGEAAAKAGVSVDTMRRWDRLGYIKAARTPSGHRRFHVDDVAKLSPRRSRDAS